MEKSIPIDILHEQVFDMFLEQLSHKHPFKHRRKDITHEVVIDGTVAKGFGVWFGSYDYRSEQWTNLYNRGTGGAINTHPRIELTFRNGTYGFKLYFYPPRHSDR